MLAGDAGFVQDALANDFRFVHGTGEITDKENWLATAHERTFTSRKTHDDEAKFATALN